MAGMKIPGFYIYYATDSWIYQDMIIGFLAFGWAMFLMSQSTLIRQSQLQTVPYLLFAGIVAIVVLSFINALQEIADLSEGYPINYYWIELGALLVYVLWLGFWYVRASRDLTPPAP